MIFTKILNINEYVVGEETLSSDQSETTQQTKFSCAPFWKAFKKQLKTIEKHGEKQFYALTSLHIVKDFISHKRLNTEIMNEHKIIEE